MLFYPFFYCIKANTRINLIQYYSTMWLIITLLSAACAIENNVELFEPYLDQYGYLSKDEYNSNQESAIRTALKSFQDYYNLPSENIEKTLEFMSQPRCGNPDINDNNYAIGAVKWSSNNIKWSTDINNWNMFRMIQQAFSVWEKHANIHFEYSATNFNIFISLKKMRHTTHKNYACLSFDGPGQILGHAFHPHANNNTADLHLDGDEDWYTDNTNPAPYPKTSFFNVLVHEIGHSLGLHHSANRQSVMYAYANDHHQNLSRDDVLGIQKIYGPPTTNISSTTTTTTTTTKKPTITTVKSTTTEKPTTVKVHIRPAPPSLCSVNMDHFLILNKRLYMFYDKWVWIMPLNSTLTEPPKYIPDWLPFLPKQFSKITAIYQKPNTNVVMFINRQIYEMQFPSFQLLPGYPKSYISVNIPQTAIITAAINAYSGRTYIFYDKNQLIEFDDCEMRAKTHLLTSNVFPCVPINIKSIFRYTNGFLYFMIHNKYYEYNEFTNTCGASGPKDLSVFKVQCENKNILEQLRDILTKLLSLNVQLEAYQEPLDDSEYSDYSD